MRFKDKITGNLTRACWLYMMLMTPRYVAC